MREEEKYDRIRKYLTGGLPLEEAQALEAEIAADPETALQVQFFQLEERELPRYQEDDLEMEINGWLPGLKALQRAGSPLWALSLLAGTMLIGMAGARSRRRSHRKVRSPGRPLPHSRRSPASGGLATDSEPEPSEGH